MKQRLDIEVIAMRIAKEFRDGCVVNLGYGLPTLCSSYIPEDMRVILHTENGALGFGRVLTEDDRDKWDQCLVNASGQFVSTLPGMSFFDHATSFGIIGGGYIDISVLGGLQVSEKGDLANWLVPGRSGGMGGAMDIAAGAKKIIVGMEHVSKDGQPKILKKCSYPLTAPECVDLIVTDIAVIEVSNKGLILKELAPGWSINDVQKQTEPKLIIAEDLKETEL